MKTLIALAVSGLLATSVMAEGNKEITGMTDKDTMEATSEFMKLDVDNDANLTKMEITKDPKLTKLNTDDFSTADIDQDGKLNHDEFVAWFKDEDMAKQYSSAPVEEESMYEEQDDEDTSYIDEDEEDTMYKDKDEELDDK
ncbi:MAG: hypothetical protein ACJA13_004130 [Paraglaciecola sp.]|jgi:hypothetical protein